MILEIDNDESKISFVCTNTRSSRSTLNTYIYKIFQGVHPRQRVDTNPWCLSYKLRMCNFKKNFQEFNTIYVKTEVSRDKGIVCFLLNETNI